jgi:hypothetical protein
LKKISKSGEQTSIIQKERKQRRSKEEKEIIIQRLKKKLKLHKQLLLDPFGLLEEEWTEDELRKQEQELNDLNNRKKPVKPKIPKVNNRKKFISDLLCPHLKLVRKGDYVVCTKCGAKFKAKAKNNKGTIK